MCLHRFLANVLLRKVLGKAYGKTERYHKSQIIRQITAFLRSEGCRSIASKFRNGGDSFADVQATIEGKPVEVLVGVKRLSKPQINYGKTISNSGGLFVSVMNAQDFRDWYYRKTIIAKIL